MRRVAVFVAACWTSVGAAAAQPVAMADWSGFHVSGLVGATLAQSDTSASSPSATSTYFTATDFAQLAAAGDGSLSPTMFSGSLKGGYSWQFGHLLVGIETSVDSLFIDDERSASATYLSAPPAGFTLRQQVKADWMATLRPRLGWAQDRWLVYLTGGLAVARVTVETTFTDNFIPATGGASGQSSNTDTKFGATVGAGGEYAIDEHWSVAFQYLYTDFGSVSTTALVTNPGSAGNSSTLDSSADLRTHSAMIGVTYRSR